MEQKDSDEYFVESNTGLVLRGPMPEEKPQGPTEKPKKKHEAKIVGVVLFILALGLFAFAATQIDFRAISDNIAGNGYEFTGEIADVADHLQLTDTGRRILKATHPELQGKEDFNESCTVALREGITLGCHDSNRGRIYVYNIHNDELDGIRESILAHELLHAVWDRLTWNEKDTLSKELQNVYDENEEVRKNMEIYQDTADFNELHSVVGQIVHPDALSQTLRDHYAKYFKNHDVVVAFYESYSEPFEHLRNRIEELRDIIAARREEYTKAIEKFNAENKQLTLDTNQFNACAEQYGCFKSLEEFNTQRNALISRQDQLMLDYQTNKEEALALNKLIKEYNTMVINQSELQESINSKSEAPKTLEVN